MAASRQVTSMTASQRGRQRSTTKNTARACRTHAIASGSVTSAASTATLAPHHAGRAEDRRRMSQRLPAAIVPLALYCVAVVWLTWPLAAHLRTHLPSTEVACSFDTLLIAWVLAWQTHALATAPLHFAQANIYHPARHALFYCEAGVGALPYYAPAFLLTGSPALALNVTLLGGVALTAWALHLVVRR